MNKVATAVELRFDVSRVRAAGGIKQRLTILAAGRLTANGVLLIDSREHRTQAQNREAARERLIGLIRQAARRRRDGGRPPNNAARERRLQSKRRRSEVKKLRGRGDD